MDINQAFENYERKSDEIVIVCIDELRYYDDRHIDGAECLPYRLFTKILMNIILKKI